MKIAIFTDSYIPMRNGVANSVYLLKNGLLSLGHSVCLVRPSIPRCSEVSSIIIPSAACSFLPEMRIALPLSFGISRQLDEFCPDIIHTHTEFAVGRLGRIEAAKRGIPLVHTYHTIYEDYVHYIKTPFISESALRAAARSFSASVCRKADCVIAPTKKVEKLLRSYGVDNRIECIMTGIPVERFAGHRNTGVKKKLREAIGILPDDKALLYVGRISEEKKLETLLKYFDLYALRNSNSKLLLVGDGSESQMLKSLAASLACSGKIIFCGSHRWENIPYFYKIADVFVSASTSETQGLTFAEALASGVPVLAKRDECLENVVFDGVNGFFFDDCADFCRKLDIVFSEQGAQFKANALKSGALFSDCEYACRVAALYASLRTKEKRAKKVL